MVPNLYKLCLNLPLEFSSNDAWSFFDCKKRFLFVVLPLHSSIEPLVEAEEQMVEEIPVDPEPEPETIAEEPEIPSNPEEKVDVGSNDMLFDIV